MEYGEFLEAVQDEIKGRMPKQIEVAEVSIKQITKNNGIVQDGLVVQSKMHNSSPVIYLNHFYDDYLNGKSMETILDDIYKILENNREMDVNISAILDFERVRGNITARLCNAEMNASRLEQIPCRYVEDLAVTYHILLGSSGDGEMSVTISKSLQEKLGVSEEELYATAMENIGKKENVCFCSVYDMIQDMLCLDFVENTGANEFNARNAVKEMMPKRRLDNSLYVLTNREKIYGAAVVLNDDVCKMIAEKVGGDYYILPSSVHEVLIIPKNDGMDWTELESMVKDVNQSEVSLQDKLSDHVYEYHAETKEFIRLEETESNMLQQKTVDSDLDTGSSVQQKEFRRRGR